jgi:hypothetical protein
MRDDAAGAQAIAWFAQAIEIIGGFDRRSEQVRFAAEALLDNGFGRWRCDDGVWISEGEHSRRNPATRTLRPTTLRRVSEALALPRSRD